jgi:AcrR family transcriptional regulator
VPTVEERMDSRIARLALARFRVGGFAGTSIADLAGDLGVSKAAIYYHYRSKDALLHRLIDPLLDAIDTCIQDHNTPAPSARTARQLLAAYLTVLTAHQEVVPLVATDVAVLNHPKIGPRLRTQNQRLRTLLAAPDTSVSARLRAEAALGAIWRPLVAEPQIDLTDTAHQQTLIDAAVATLQPSRAYPDQGPDEAASEARRNWEDEGGSLEGRAEPSIPNTVGNVPASVGPPPVGSSPARSLGTPAPSAGWSEGPG